MPPRRISQEDHKERSPRVIVSVNPDGSVDAVYNSATDAAKQYGILSQTIRHYCRSGMIGVGKKWFYEERFREIYMTCEMDKLKFTLPDGYVPKEGGSRKGHTRGNGWDKMKEESRAAFRERGKILVRRIFESGGLERSNRKTSKPVVCITDGKEFPSIRRAAEYYGIPRSCIGGCIHRVGSTRGLKFRFKSQLESIKEVI